MVFVVVVGLVVVEADDVGCTSGGGRLGGRDGGGGGGNDGGGGGGCGLCGACLEAGLVLLEICWDDDAFDRLLDVLGLFDMCSSSEVGVVVLDVGFSCMVSLVVTFVCLLRLTGNDGPSGSLGSI